MTEQNIPDYLKDIWDKENITPEDLKLILDYREYNISPDELRLLVYRCAREPIPDNFSEMKYYEKIVNGIEDERANIVNYCDERAYIRVDIGWNYLLFEVRDGILFLIYETTYPSHTGDSYFYEIGEPTSDAVLDVIKLYKTEGKVLSYSNPILPELLDNRKRLANTIQ